MTVFRLKQQFEEYRPGTMITPVMEAQGVWIFDPPSIALTDAEIDTHVEIDRNVERLADDTDAESSLKARIESSPKASSSSSSSSASSRTSAQSPPLEISLSDSDDDAPLELEAEDFLSSPVSSTLRLRRKQVSAKDDELSACVDERILGYLSVQITFLGEPVVDLAVSFVDEDDAVVEGTPFVSEDDAEVEGPPKPVKTDAKGCYSLKELVDAGTYVCRIEHQNKAQITTVEKRDNPFQLVLPIGRPYFDTYNLQLEGEDGKVKND